MKMKLKDLINFEQINILLEDFNKTTGFVTAILDLEGNVLAKSGWRSICTEFHRKHPIASKKCTESDTYLAGEIANGEKFHYYKCKNGLIDVAGPIIIDGEQVGNLFTGQFFLSEPDRDFFRKQAAKYGFDHDSYFDALDKVPVVSEYKLKTTMNFLLNIIHLISELTIKRSEQIELNKALINNEQEIINLNKDLGLRIAQRTVQLENTNKELESFVYSVSHDLRSPLRSIMGFSQIIHKRHKDELNEEGLEYFGYILEASKNMANLIEDLLSFSRLAKSPVTKESINMKEIIELVLKNLNQDITEKNAKIIVQNNMPYVKGDRSLLGQIFANLINNSIMYHRQGISPGIHITYEEDKNNIIIKVKDNGLGIPKEHHEKIFNIFQRLHSNDDYPGTGIGLSIVKKAVTTLGGKITIDSELNIGSIFSVILPK